jgi:transposase
VTHRNAPLSVEGRRRLVVRCQTRPIAHVATEMGVSRACASKWVNRYRTYGEIGLHDRPSVPHHQPTATSTDVVARIEVLRRTRKWSASRIAFELSQQGVIISRRTVSRHLAALGLNRRRFIDPTGQTNRSPQRIIARRPGHMIHVDVKKVAHIPDGGGWRIHGKGSAQAKAVVAATKAGTRAGYVYLHTAVDGFSRLAYTEALPDEKAITAIGFMHRARVWFAAHGIIHIQRIVTDNGACYRAKDFAHVLHGARHQFIAPTPQRQGRDIPPHPGRGIPLRPHLDLRNPTGRSTQDLEHPLQLPPTTLCRRRPATSITTHYRRHQPQGLIQLARGMGSFGRRNHRDPRGQSLRTRVPRHVHRNPTRLHQ